MIERIGVVNIGCMWDDEFAICIRAFDGNPFIDRKNTFEDRHEAERALRDLLSPYNWMLQHFVVNHLGKTIGVFNDRRSANEQRLSLIKDGFTNVQVEDWYVPV